MSFPIIMINCCFIVIATSTGAYNKKTNATATNKVDDHGDP